MKTQHVSYVLVLLLILVATRALSSRPLSNTSNEVISDGFKEETTYSVSMIGLKGGVDSPCEQMYGFLPCSDSIGGDVFLILVYEYLLFHGESYVASGGQRIFKILGPGVFGACAFQIIGSLPEALILLASGLLSDKEVAEECVLTGVGLLTGSSILLLTLVWGTCLLLSTQDFNKYLHPIPSDCTTTRNPLERVLLSLWPGYGVMTDSWTCYTARIMIVSLIPFAIIQIPRLLQLSFFWERIVVVVTLVSSVILLLAYFFYQLFQPRIQSRQLLYLKNGCLAVDILKLVQTHTMESLFTDDGSPNLSVIRSILEKTAQDRDKYLTVNELREFFEEINLKELYPDKDKASEDMMKEFDVDNDQKITIDEFVKGMEKWIEETKKDSGKTYRLNEVLQPWIEKKREELELMKNIVPEIMEHLQASKQGGLLREDGTPDIPAIKRLFQEIDHDKDDLISYSEVKDLMMDIKFGTTPQDSDAAASKMIEELDINGDHLLNEDEFVNGLSKLLNTTYINQTEETEESDYQKKWEQTDELVEDKLIDKSLLSWMKAISLVVVGIVMLGVTAEPLIQNVQNLSKAASIPSFFIAFIFVPLATNARIAISAISEARRKKRNIISLTFSEIYGTVLMNNLLGFSVLLSLVYFRGLSWNFSMEVLMVLIVSAFMGSLASFSTIFPAWTSLFAYLLYPVSLFIVNLLGDFNWSSYTIVPVAKL